MVEKLYIDGDEKRIQPEKITYAHRSPWRRDYSRLMHSSAFRRLQRKTQLFPGENDFFRNRLTHSLEVAQVAKSIAQRINVKKLQNIYDEKKFVLDGNSAANPSHYLISPDLVEFAALAHDIGHPPFGHNGEEALDEAMSIHGGFEGNAQSLRIITKLIPRVKSNFQRNNPNLDLRRGINPTLRSIASVLKYDNQIQSRAHGAKIEKGYYGTESEIVKTVKEVILRGKSLETTMKRKNFIHAKDNSLKSIKPNEWKSEFDGYSSSFKTVECQIMDLADDIAYCCYDLEDAMRAGFTSPLDIISKIQDDYYIGKFVIDHFSKKDPSLIGVTTDNATPELRDKVTKHSNEVKEDLLSLYKKLMNPPEMTDDDIPKTMENIDKYVLQTYMMNSRVSSDGYVRSAAISELVAYFVDKIEFYYNEINPALSIVKFPSRIRQEIEVLKNFTYRVHIMSPRLKTVEYRGKRIVLETFEALKSKRGRYLLPSDWQTAYNMCNCEHAKARIISDYVAGMSDRFAIEFYERLFSTNAGSIFTT